MTVFERIEHWTGPFPDARALKQFLDESVKEVIADVDRYSLSSLYVELTDSGSGASTLNHRVIEARKGLYKAAQISPSFRTNEWAADTEPQYYTWSGLTYIIPGGGTILAIPYPAIVLSTETFTNVPDDLLRLFSLKTAYVGLEFLMGRIQRTMSQSPVMPDPPQAPPGTAAYVDAALGTFTASATIAALPALQPFGISVFGGALGDIGAAADAYQVKVDDLRTRIDAIVAALPTAPGLTEDIDTTAISAPTAPTAPSIPVFADGGLTDTTVDFTDVVPPVYIQSPVTVDFTDWDAYFDGSATGDDPEMMAGIIQKLSLDLNRARTDIEQGQTDFQAKSADHQAQIQKAIEEARLAIRTKELEQTESNKLQVSQYVQTLQQYVAQLQTYDKEFSLYMGKIEVVLKKYAADISVVTTSLASMATDLDVSRLEQERTRFEIEEQRLNVEVLRTRITEASANYQGYIADHRSEVERIITQAQLDQQRFADMFGRETDMNLRNAAETARASAANLQADLQKYNTQVAAYGQEVASVVEEQRVTIQLKGEKLRMMARERDSVGVSYTRGKSAYENAHRQKHPQRVTFHEF